MKFLQYKENGHIKLAVKRDDCVIPVSYTHLTLPTTPYV